MIETFEIVDRASWLARRRNDVTASVIGALFNQHKYVTPLRLYAQHRGVEFPEKSEDDPVLRRGRWLEPSVAEAVRELRPEWRIEKAKVYLRDPDLRLGATPDFFIHDDPRGLGVLQAKTIAPSVYRHEWDSGGEVPLYIQLQALTEMMLTNAAFGAVAALLIDAHAMDVVIHEIPRHPTAETRIIDAVKTFWKHVDFGNEPAPDIGRDAETIRVLRPREEKGKGIDLSGNNAIRENLEQRAMLLARIKDDETRCSEIETELKFLMGDAEFVTGLNGWKITFKSSKRDGYTVAPRTIRSLRITDRRPPDERPDGSDLA